MKNFTKNCIWRHGGFQVSVDQVKTSSEFIYIAVTVIFTSRISINFVGAIHYFFNFSFLVEIDFEAKREKNK